LLLCFPALYIYNTAFKRPRSGASHYDVIVIVDLTPLQTLTVDSSPAGDVAGVVVRSDLSALWHAGGLHLVVHNDGRGQFDHRNVITADAMRKKTKTIRLGITERTNFKMG